MEDPIKEFFSRQEVLITGATGLLGKSLVEILLRSCPEIKRLYLLIREKKGKSTEERIKELKNSRIFSRLKEENKGDTLNKLIPITGDIMKIGLGLSDQDKHLLKDVTLIYHSAATIRFDEPLKYAILMNIRGTQQMLEFAKTLSHCRMFVHVSTAYSNPNEPYVKEEVYPPKADWKKYVKMAEKLSDEEISIFEAKLIGDFPNSYTITKHLAERVIHDYRQKLPVSIFRPSILHCAGTEPFPGWYDNFIAVMGILAGVYTGVVRILYCDSSICLDLVPIDEVVKCLICDTWYNQQLEEKEGESDKVKVLVCCSGNFRSYSIKTMIDINNTTAWKWAFNKTFWFPNFGLTDNIYWYYVNIYLFHCLPAIFVDGLLRLFGQKPVLLSIQRKSLSLQKAYKFFLFTDYNFESKKLHDVLNMIKDRSEDFRFDTLLTKSAYELSGLSQHGVRKFLLKEDDTSLPSAQKRLKVLKWVDFLCKKLFIAYVAYYIFNKMLY